MPEAVELAPSSDAAPSVASSEPSADGGSPTPSEASVGTPTSDADPAAIPGAESAPTDGGGDSATLAEGGGAGDGDAPQGSPADWPDNWRDIMAGGDKKALGLLNRYTSPVNVFKALRGAQSKMSSGDLMAAKPDGSDEAALNEWRASAGIPDKPEGYLDKLPDGLVIGEEDRPMVDSFVEAMHAIDAPPEFVHAGLAWNEAEKLRQAEALTENNRQNRVQSEDELRAEWGPEYRANVNGLHSLFAAHGEDGLLDQFFGATMPDGTHLGDHPDTLRFLVAVNRELNPHGTVTPASGQTPLQTIQAEIAQLKVEMRDKKGKTYDYYDNPAKQARYRELLEMQDRHKGRGG